MEKKCGRPPGLIVYTPVIYNTNEYMVGTLVSKGKEVKFVFDKDDFDKIKDKTWHLSTNRYISHGITVDGKKKEVYLHNLVMDRLEHPGKGSKESIDHINRNGLDNRKENLRLITQTEQNLNQKRKERRIELPIDSEINLEDIPKHIWYIKANGHHGDRFGIDLKTEGIKWKTTSSKSVPLKDKLQLAIQQLNIYYAQYPYLNPENDESTMLKESLAHSYDEIIKVVE
jgi:Na+/phosphate symporter